MVFKFRYKYKNDWCSKAVPLAFGAGDMGSKTRGATLF